MVEVASAFACERCAAGKGCGAGLFGSGDTGTKRVTAIVATDLDVRNGDQVKIALEPRHLLKASFVVYGYPILGAVFAAVIARGLGMNDAAAAIAALSGLVLGILVAKFRLGRTQCLREFTPTVVERLARAPGT